MKKTFSDVELINNHKLIGFLDDENILKLYTKDKENCRIEKFHKLNLCFNFGLRKV